MSSIVAVVAHTKKLLSSGVDRLRMLIAEEGFGHLWHEVPTS
ncbi:hypothetical protein [Nonomuraea polychroma]|nr:hypothetical protein [Nonomuraea polychroma]